ncbi:MAG: Hsp20/alpha crystallin family protein [Bacteroidetes bacterium]|jgi:HSP20 family molecular chaperone IbpA|nr:Hsp20/alpha crystallin family protein [Bacteroidota bacterium]
MLYTTNLSRMLDEVFTFPYQTKVLDNSFVYDFVKTEKDGSSKIEVVVPGYSKEDLKLEVSDGILKLWCDLEGKKFKRHWKISDSVDTKKIKAECKNGILTVSLTLKEKSSKVSSITIE